MPYLSDCKWTATSEYICIPDISETRTTKAKGPSFKDLRACAAATFHNIKNKRVWVENSSQPLYDYVAWWNTLDRSKKYKSLNRSGESAEDQKIRVLTGIVVVVVTLSLFRGLKYFLFK